MKYTIELTGTQILAITDLLVDSFRIHGPRHREFYIELRNNIRAQADKQTLPPGTEYLSVARPSRRIK